MLAEIERRTRDVEASNAEVLRLNTELERRVTERTAELKSANRELESFSYSVSHDLRSPLRAIDGYSLMLEEDYADKLDDEGRRLLRVIRDSSGHMARLIDDLLRFSQLGRKPLAMASLDMTGLAKEVIQDFSSAHPTARIELGSLPSISGDRSLFRQVWTNLISNALKYSSRRTMPYVEIGGRAEEAENVFWVRDNGAGFDMKYYEKLFGVFQRLHRSDEFEGTGVGLAIVQRVVNKHGGRVWAESGVGEGAVFRFAFPKES
jgi:light-regulated signal transduction histidine kinase (bacteriophytochrome)